MTNNVAMRGEQDAISLRRVASESHGVLYSSEQLAKGREPKARERPLKRGNTITREQGRRKREEGRKGGREEKRGGEETETSW